MTSGWTRIASLSTFFGIFRNTSWIIPWKFRRRNTTVKSDESCESSALNKKFQSTSSSRSLNHNPELRSKLQKIGDKKSVNNKIYYSRLIHFLPRIITDVVGLKLKPVSVSSFRCSEWNGAASKSRRWSKVCVRSALFLYPRVADTEILGVAQICPKRQHLKHEFTLPRHFTNVSLRKVTGNILCLYSSLSASIPIPFCHGSGLFYQWDSTLPPGRT